MKALTISVFFVCVMMLSSLNVYGEANKRTESVKALPWTELMQAAADGDTKTLKRVLGKGEDPNVRSSNGWTPLMWAADGGHANAPRISFSTREEALTLPTTRARQH